MMMNRLMILMTIQLTEYPDLMLPSEVAGVFLYPMKETKWTASLSWRTAASR